MVEDLQLHSPMVFVEPDSDDGEESEGRQVQIVLDEADPNTPARFEIYSRGPGEDGWTQHAEGFASAGAAPPDASDRVDLDDLKSRLESKDVSEFYRSRASTGVELGAPFRSLRALWAAEGEAVGELSLPEAVDLDGVEVHPLLLDGCFQVMAEARSMATSEDGVAYLPFGWESLWLKGPLPDQVVCHARLREAEEEVVGIPEVLTGDLVFCDRRGAVLGAPRLGPHELEAGGGELLHRLAVVEAKHDSPVPGDAHAPKFGQVTLESMQSPSRVATHAIGSVRLR